MNVLQRFFRLRKTDAGLFWFIVFMTIGFIFVILGVIVLLVTIFRGKSDNLKEKLKEAQLSQSQLATELLRLQQYPVQNQAQIQALQQKIVMQQQQHTQKFRAEREKRYQEVYNLYPFYVLTVIYKDESEYDISDLDLIKSIREYINGYRIMSERLQVLYEKIASETETESNKRVTLRIIKALEYDMKGLEQVIHKKAEPLVQRKIIKKFHKTNI